MKNRSRNIYKSGNWGENFEKHLLKIYKYPIFLDFHWFCEFSEPLQRSSISWFSLVLWILWAITNTQYFLIFIGFVNSWAITNIKYILIFTGFVNSLSHYKYPIFPDFHWFCEFSEPLQISNISWFSLVLRILWAITKIQYFLIFIDFVNSLSHYKYPIFLDFHWFCEFSEPLQISNISWLSLVLWILWAITNIQYFLNFIGFVNSLSQPDCYKWTKLLEHISQEVKLATARTLFHFTYKSSNLWS